MRNEANKKIVLCRPQGGLNDILSTIQKCRIYAKKHNRILYVDTNYKTAISFNDHFSNYFFSRDPDVILGPLPEKYAENDPTVFPKALQGRIFDYQTNPKIPFRNITDTLTGIEITFDFQKSYAEQILIHHQTGGGPSSVNALEILYLNPTLINALRWRQRIISTEYHGLHIRHSDYLSDFKGTIVAALRKQGNIFLCTDNEKIRNAIKNSKEKNRIFTFCESLGAENQPIHLKKNNLNASTDIYARNRDAILDLFTLSFATEIFSAPIIKRVDKGKVTRFKKPFYSGFAILASQLNRNRNILNMVTGSGVDPAL